MTPLRLRMTEDMQVRILSPHTQDSYVRQVAQFARHFRKSPEELGPEDIRSYTELVIAYSQLGQIEEAKAMVSEILKKNPKFSLKRYAKSRFYKDPEQIELELDALRKAGLT